MNSAKVRPPRPDAPIYARALRRVPEIARRAVRQFVDEVPFYRLLPRDVLDGEATDSAAAALGVFLRAVREGKAPSPEELTVSLNAAAHRAQEQVPLAAVLAVYHIAARVGWESLIEIAAPDEFDEVLAAGPHVLRYLQEIVPAVAGVYLEERQAIHGEERETRRALVSALLTGQPAGALAARAQVQVAGAYVLLRLRLKTTEEAAPTAGAAMTARRRVRQIQAVLDEYAGGPVLGTFDGHGGIALLPATPDTVDDVLSGLSDVVTKVRGSVDVDVVAGAAGAPDIASVPAAAAQASEIADLAAGLARPPGSTCLTTWCWSTRSPGRARRGTGSSRGWSPWPSTSICSTRSGRGCTKSTTGAARRRACTFTPTPSTTGCTGSPRSPGLIRCGPLTPGCWPPPWS